MKKRILALVLSLVMLLTCTMPAFAENDISDSDVSDSDVIVITEEDIKAVCDAYMAEKTALEGNDKEKVLEAFDKFMAVADIYNEFEDEHMAKLADMIGCTADSVWSTILDVHLSSGIISEVNGKADMFIDSPTQDNALDFVDYYDAVFSDDTDAETQALVRRYFPDIDDIHAEALALLPSKEVLRVHNAFLDLSSVLWSGDLYSLTVAQNAFNDVLDIINNMSEKDFDDLGSLLGCDGEEAYSRLLDINISGNVILETETRYYAYIENPTKETATSFIEYYDALFNDPSYNDENLRQLVRTYFYDIDTLYSKANALSLGQNFIRLSGKSRANTAVAISRELYTFSSFVIIASGENYADALAGVPLAYTYSAPILLMGKGSSYDATYNDLKRLEADQVFILGGEAAVSMDVEDRLVRDGYNVTRIYGKTRHETSAEIGNIVKNNYGRVDEVFFVCANNYPDALSISNVAAIKGVPILFIDGSGKLNSEVENFIKENNVKTATIIGGTGAISASAEKNIKACGIKNVTRISGKNRYETCLEVNNAYAELFVGDALCAATGENFPDALAGGALAANFNAPLVLVDNKSLSQSQKDYISGQTVQNVYVFGGSGVVSDKVAKEIADLAKAGN